MAERDLSFAEQLRADTVAVRLSINRFGISRKLTSDQTERAADVFTADGSYLRASKKLIDARQPKILAITSVLNEVKGYVEGITVPYPEPGVRLLRREYVEQFTARLDAFRQTLAGAVTEADEDYHETIIPAARERLGELFDSANYPADLRGCWSIDWDWPNVEPPDVMRELHPELYAQEQERIVARFDEAIALTQQAFQTEFAELLSRIVDRLTPKSDGKQKVFRDSMIGNLSGFFDSFRELNIGSSEALEGLIAQARDAVEGVTAKGLRKDANLASEFKSKMNGVYQQLEPLMVDRQRKFTLADLEEEASEPEQIDLPTVDGEVDVPFEVAIEGDPSVVNEVTSGEVTETREELTVDVTVASDERIESEEKVLAAPMIEGEPVGSIESLDGEDTDALWFE